MSVTTESGRFGRILTSFVAASLLVHCQQSSPPAAEGDSRLAAVKATPELRAAELPIAYSAVTHIAQVNEFIGREGLGYRVISVPAGPDLITALRGGSSSAVDFGSLAVTPIVVMIGAGEQPVILATTLESDVRVQLVTFTGSGITDDPRTLKDKRVGYVPSTVGEIYLSRLLKSVGYTEKDIRAVSGRPADVKSLLLRGDIDAAVLWDPFVAQAVREGSEQARGNDGRGMPSVHVDPKLYTLRFNIVATRQKLAQHRAELVKFLRANLQAGDWIRNNPQNARRQLEKWLGLQEGDLRHFIETTSFNLRLDVRQLERDMRDEIAWLRERQPMTQVPEDFSAYVDASLLKEIDASRVVE